MSGIIALIIVGVCAAAALITAARFAEHARKHGKLTTTGRWIGGIPLDGRPRTPAGRDAARTGSGRKHPDAPRRALTRHLATVAILASAWGLEMHRAVTLRVLAALAAAGVLAGIWHLTWTARNWTHVKDNVDPLEQSLATAGIPARDTHVARDHSTVRLEFGPDFDVQAKDKVSHAVLAAVPQIAIAGPPGIAWSQSPLLRRPVAVFTKAEPMPGFVAWAEIAEAAEAAAEHELVLGLTRKGPRNPFITSVELENPHLGLSMPTGDGKALALDTLVPIPSGWTTMGEIKAGDVVYDETGAPCKVTDAWAIRYDRPCYEVEFSDGSVIIADGEHQWLAETRSSRANDRRDRAPRKRPRTVPRVVTTEQMAASLHDGAYRNYSVRVAGALQCPDAELPVDPYLLGYWLGDGTSRCARITVHEEDWPNLREQIGGAGYHHGTPVPYPEHPETIGVTISTQPVCNGGREDRDSMNGRLRDLGLLQNKHIPEAYLRASEVQRRALLAGLLDTDGTCNKRGGIMYYSTSERLARGVFHLAATLGYKPVLNTRTARLAGKDCGTCWSVGFTTSDPVFRLPRKAVRQVTKVRTSAARRYVTGIRPVASVPVRCIAVDSESHLYLAGDACIPTHNSVTARLAASQLAHHGALVVVLDRKLASHMWAAALPNVAYARTIAEVHELILWLAAEGDRRNALAVQYADVEGVVHANPGARIVALLEELNATAAELKSFWRSIGGQGMSPAVIALDRVAFTGRAVAINLVYIGQRLSAKATGGGSADSRENLGLKLISNPAASTWKMLVGDRHALPAGSDVKGRLHVVSAKTSTEIQAAFMTGAEARAYATSGALALAPADMPCLGIEGALAPVGTPERAAQEASGAARRLILHLVPDSDEVRDTAGSGPDVAPSPGHQPQSALLALPAPEPLTIAELVERGITGPTPEAVRKQMQRDRKDGTTVPEPVRKKGSAPAYDPVEFADWEEGRRLIGSAR